MQEIAILFSASGDVRQKLFAKGVSFFEKNTTHLLTYLLLRACMLKSVQNLILRSIIQTCFYSLIQTKVQVWSLIKKGSWLFFTFLSRKPKKLSVMLERCWKTIKVPIFWEDNTILQNLHLTFDWHYIGQKEGGDFAKLCGLLRIYEFYNNA